MTPTLLDVVMLTGLGISESDQLIDTVIKATHRLSTKSVGGWKGYIAAHSRIGLVDERERIAFLNMWLEKFILCRSTCGPTTNMQSMAEWLISGSKIPLGKHLLGAVYHLLHQVSARLATNQTPSTIGGPWWFIQLWLNMHIRKAINKNITDYDFPADHSKELANIRRRCKKIGEAASFMPIERLSPSKEPDFFRSFYNGFKDSSTIWVAYEEKKHINLKGHTFLNLTKHLTLKILVRKPFRWLLLHAFCRSIFLRVMGKPVCIHMSFTTLQ